MKISHFLLAGLVGADGSGEEPEIITAKFDVKLNVNSDKDLMIRINQVEFEKSLNDDDGDNILFTELEYSVAPGHGLLGEPQDYVVSGKASVTEETTDDATTFVEKMKKAIEEELKESGDPQDVTSKGTETQSCTDGKNGGCSHFCTDNRCSCPSCWSLGPDMKTCAPTDGEIVITCSEDEMKLAINECVIEDNSGFKLLDPSCAPTLTNGVWDVTTSLDSCGTTLELDKDSQIVTFTNQLQAAPEIQNGIIMSRSLAMEFECQYGTAYDDVSNNRTIIGGHIVTSASSQEGTFGTGNLGFSLNFYTSSKFDTLIDPESMIMVGETLFFTIEAYTAITGLVFTVMDCTVSDPTLGAEYDILVAQCPDKFVGTTINSLSHTDTLQFSYTAFQFAGTTGTETQEKLSCSVLVCDNNAGAGPCADAPTCGNRRKRSDIEQQGQLFYVSQTINLRK